MQFEYLLGNLKIPYIDMKFEYVTISNINCNKICCSNKPLEMTISMTQIPEFINSCLLFPNKNVWQKHKIMY